MKDWLEWALAAVAFVVTVAVRAEVALLFIACGVVGVLYYGSLFRGQAGLSTTSSFLAVTPLVAAGASATPSVVLGKLFAFFLKAGSLTFGSGLVIVSFLEKGLVQHTNWLTEHDFLVAVAMGMISPGPVLITATFVGYLVAGFWGAVVATIGTILGACVLLARIAIGDWLTALVALGSLVVLFRWKVSNPLLVAVTAIIGLIAFPLLNPSWVFVK